MSVFQGAVLGLIQGLTEFLPVSSSGHLVLFQMLFGLEEGNLAFDTMLHLGTLVAVFIVFWSDIIDMIKRPFSKLTLLVVIGTIPTAIIGLGFKDFFESLFASGSVVGYTFLATGLILWLAESVPNGNKSTEKMSFFDAVFIGVLQGMAILPGISRSGTTIAGALFRKIDRDTAAKYSFLLSIPAILGAVVLQGKDVLETGGLQVEIVPMLVGTLVAAISGYLAIKWMLKILNTGSLKVFSIYVWILGIVVLSGNFLA